MERLNANQQCEWVMANANKLFTAICEQSQQERIKPPDPALYETWLPVECFLWLALNETAQADYERLSGYYETRLAVAERFFSLPGFILAVNIGEPAVHYYATALARCMGLTPEQGGVLGRELISLFERRSPVPMPHSEEDLAESQLALCPEYFCRC